jgi:hypothetical protein
MDEAIGYPVIYYDVLYIRNKVITLTMLAEKNDNKDKKVSFPMCRRWTGARFIAALDKNEHY